MEKVIGIVGLGYVGLPLAVEFGTIRKTFGFDIDSKRIKELIDGIDTTLETSKEELLGAKNLSFFSELSYLANCEIFIITVPTPIDKHNNPDLGPLISASKAIGSVLKQGDIVIYESTVYPGATEEVCVPVLEEISGLSYNKDFYCGYSPERINPGDKEHRLRNIKKITSGSTEEISKEVDKLYNEIIEAGTHRASSIKVAEAAKVIENTQRDVNIALINELSIIFDKLDIDTEEVLKAAGTKWNFLPFRPGLVGGHCIGVDPYYLTYKSIEIGYIPEMILAGRKLNDNMASFVASKVSKIMTSKKINILGANVLILGFAFKENCPDIRNTKVIDIVNEFERSNCNVDIYDPWVSHEEVFREYKKNILTKVPENFYDAIILCVAHEEFRKLDEKFFKRISKDKYVLFDVKYSLDKNIVDARL